MDFNQVPHLMLMNVGVRHMVSIMLPALLADKSKDRTSAVPEDVQAELYDKCLLPTILELDPGEQGHWPPSFAAEVNRITLPTGGRSYGTQIVAARFVYDFGERVLQLVRSQKWGRNAFYLHQLRGTRGETVHHRRDRSLALEDYLNQLDVANIDPKEWWIDCGVEIQFSQHVLWWRKDAHWLILQRCFEISDDHAGELVRAQSKMALDYPCQLTEVAGFRFSPSRDDRGETHIHYVQAYNTEKSVTYLLHGGLVAKHLELRKVLHDIKAVSKYADSLSTMFQDAARGPHDGHARLEWRVRLDMVMHLEFYDDPAELARLVVAFDSATWW